MLVLAEGFSLMEGRVEMQDLNFALLQTILTSIYKIPQPSKQYSDALAFKCHPGKVVSCLICIFQFTSIFLDAE